MQIGRTRGRVGRAVGRRLVAAGTAVVLVLGLAGAALTTPAEAAGSTSALEKRRVDRVKAPRLDWYECAGTGVECATARVPLDYDLPQGPTVELALLRVKARDQKHRIGSLFVNPGGPGGSAVEFALYADLWAGEGMRDRFDIIGMDPRGIGYSDNVRCFASVKDQAQAYATLPDVAFPVTAAQDKAWTAFPKALGRACSSTGRPLAASMSTAQVARDLDVMRRAVGDAKLNYLGISYGSVLGTTYANLFPDRFRTLAVDGIVDPQAWAGSDATKSQYVWDRLKSAEGGYRALIEALRRCDRAGGQLCPFAPGDPVKNFDLVLQRLKQRPLQLPGDLGGPPETITYADVVSFSFSALYDTDGPGMIADLMADLIILTEPPAQARVSAASRDRSLRSVRATLQRVDAERGTPKRAGFPYNNGDDAFWAVQCTDGVAPANADDWPAYAKKADARVKYYGRMLASQGLPCASSTWTARDEDAYRGPFNRPTAKPVLVVGSRWDPITNYDSAVRLAKTMPNSRLLTSDNWGHAALGTSTCVEDAYDAYFVGGTLPAAGEVCEGEDQPFTDQAGGGGEDGGGEDFGATALQKVAAAVKENGTPFGR